MGVCFGVAGNEYSCVYGAQINIGDLTPYLTYGFRTDSPLVNKLQTPERLAGLPDPFNKVILIRGTIIS